LLDDFFKFLHKKFVYGELCFLSALFVPLDLETFSLALAGDFGIALEGGC